MADLIRRPRLLLLIVLAVTAGLAVSLATLPVEAIPTGCGDIIVVCGSWVEDGCCSTDPTWQSWSRTCWLCPQNCTPCGESWQETKCEGSC